MPDYSDHLEDLAVAAASPSNVFCKRCGYDLRGLQKGDCPECGSSFDLERPSTVQQGPPRKTGTIMNARVFWPLFVLGIVATVAMALVQVLAAKPIESLTDWIGICGLATIGLGMSRVYGLRAQNKQFQKNKR